MSKALINLLRPRILSRNLVSLRGTHSSDDEPQTNKPKDGSDDDDNEDDINMYKRMPKRERRRLKGLNIFEAEYTGEKPTNAWLDGNKIKALGHFYEQLRNIHRLNIKYDAKEQKNMAQKMKELSEIQYKEILEEEYHKMKFQENFNKCAAEFETLPLDLKEEVKAMQEKDNFSEFFDDQINPLTLYLEQIMRIYPPNHCKRLKLGIRLMQIASDTLAVGGE